MAPISLSYGPVKAFKLVEVRASLAGAKAAAEATTEARIIDFMVKLLYRVCMYIVGYSRNTRGNSLLMDASLRPVVSNGGRLPNTRIHGKLNKKNRNLQIKTLRSFVFNNLRAEIKNRANSRSAVRDVGEVTTQTMSS